jgi:NADH dehydrogenase [ubiquinone] 1 alpha subcomplex assembly factor 1
MKSTGMKYLLIIALFVPSMNSKTIFDFHKEADLQAWQIVNDGVMGGRSAGRFGLTGEGHAVFEGNISLDNNGGFSSVRYRFATLPVNADSKIMLTIKGDGKKYQFRAKDNTGKYYSYITYFSTTGHWQNISISLRDMYPSFRGRTLDLPNFSANSIEEIVLLIGNKKAEPFKLLIDKIELQ